MISTTYLYNISNLVELVREYVPAHHLLPSPLHQTTVYYVQCPVNLVQFQVLHRIYEVVLLRILAHPNQIDFLPYEVALRVRVECQLLQHLQPAHAVLIGFLDFVFVPAGGVVVALLNGKNVAKAVGAEKNFVIGEGLNKLI